MENQPPADPLADREPVGEAVSLDRLEADLAAVASALETVDRIVAEGTGPATADEIAAVVSPERFAPLAGGPLREPAAPVAPAQAPPSDLVRDGLVDEQVDPLPE